MENIKNRIEGFIMKWIWILLIVFVSCNAIALEFPQNLQSAAVSADAATLRWDGVPGAAEYEVEFRRGIYEDFDNEEDPEGWEILIGGVTHSFNTNLLWGYADSPGMLTISLRANAQKAKFSSPKYNNVEGISFRMKKDQEKSFKFFVIPVDNDAELDKIEFNTDKMEYGSYELFTLNIELSDSCSFRFEANLVPNNAFSVRFDDFMVLLSQEEDIWHTKDYNALRIPDLSPDTQYYWRVRAKQEETYSDYSPWKPLVTAAADMDYTTGSVINNVAALIDLPTLNQKLSILPTSGNDADYELSVTIENNSYTYILSSNEEDAFIGEYHVSHPGFTASSIFSENADITDFVNEAGATTFTVNSMNRSQVFSFTLHTEETLPVELGRFALAHSDGKTLSLEWTTHSENDLLGFRILRSQSSDLAAATLISPLINASNSSSNAYYCFRDLEPLPKASYWLEIIELSGGQSYHGPVEYEAPQAAEQSPGTLKNAVQGLYPNPFNPSTTLQYSLAEAASVSLKIYNMRGQELRAFEPGSMPAGKHKMVWDGCDEKGRELGSGVYVMKVCIGKEEFLEKAVLLK